MEDEDREQLEREEGERLLRAIVARRQAEQAALTEALDRAMAERKKEDDDDHH